MKRLKVAQIGLNFHWEIIWDFHLQSGKGYGSFSTKELLHHWKAIYHGRCRLGSQFLNRSAIASLKSHWSYTRCRWDSLNWSAIASHHWKSHWSYQMLTKLNSQWKAIYNTRCWLDSQFLNWSAIASLKNQLSYQMLIGLPSPACHLLHCWWEDESFNSHLDASAHANTGLNPKGKNLENNCF